jgi:phosphoribosylformylglycinamidine synthase
VGLIGGTAHKLWHKDTSLPNDLDLVILPGGFSYGDYLRTGSIAQFSPIMKSVVEFANNGGHVMGVCNGFQILCETGLLPGALIKNAALSFVCKDVHLSVEKDDTAFTNKSSKGQILRIPVAHGDGRFIATPDVLKEIEDNGQVLFRSVDANGEQTEESNPNGSQNNIAGIINSGGNVMGMMPHPERAVESILGSTDGLTVFHSLAERIGSAVEL